ncbi:unnamed protein product, partial [Owenia fusiformis]
SNPVGGSTGFERTPPSPGQNHAVFDHFELIFTEMSTQVALKSEKRAYLSWGNVSPTRDILSVGWTLSWSDGSANVRGSIPCFSRLVSENKSMIFSCNILRIETHSTFYVLISIVNSHI